MKLLIVSWYFPPGNTIGAVRVGKLAKFLEARGVDFRVLTARDWGLPETLPLEVPPARIVSTPWRDVNELPPPLRRLRDRLRGRPPAGSAGATAGSAPGGAGPGLIGRLGDAYRALTNLPDRQIGWLPCALRGAEAGLGGWRPDLIYASAPPFTSLLVADRLARRYRCPWVAEFRDRWVDDPYYHKPGWRKALETRLERGLMRRAAAIVTVSEPWAEAFRTKYALPVATCLNGFDPDDYAAPCGGPPPGGPLAIVYTGAIYPGRRDPSPLFEALAGLGPEGDAVRVRFYGTRPDHVLPLARRAGVADRVEVLPSVPYRESVRLQRTADVLLLLQWNHAREQGNVPAKLFEYLAAQRPILGLGLSDGVPARIIRERHAGLFANEPEAIAVQLRRWLAEKRASGGVAAPAPTARRGFSRTEQFEGLAAFLSRQFEST